MTKLLLIRLIGKLFITHPLPIYLIILGQLPGVVIYSRNLWLIHKEKREQVE